MAAIQNGTEDDQFKSLIKDDPHENPQSFLEKSLWNNQPVFVKKIMSKN